MNPNRFMAVEVLSNRGEYRYIHNGKAGISTAFEIKEESHICLLIPRCIGTIDAILEVYDENLYTRLYQIEGEWQGFKDQFDEYIFNISELKIDCGLYFIRPRLSVLGSVFFGHRVLDKIVFDNDGKLDGMMQMTICEFENNEPRKIRGGVIYHIFVDRFRRGGMVDVPDGARIIPGNWKVIPEYPEYPGAPLYNNTFWGGTLWGIINKLDYIKSLGTTAIYLSPIFKSASNHKYDTSDYMTVDPIFGGEKALKHLIKECKERGIEIILDGVFNHTGSDSIYFNRFGRYQELGAFQSKKSKYYDWYDFKNYPGEYTCWWGIDILPRINPDIPQCGDFFVGEKGVIDKYSQMGVYGFRLDVADELSDAFIAKIKARLSYRNEENILYGEVWEDASNKSSYGRRRHYYLGRELDGVMNYPLRAGIIDYVMGKGCEKLYYALTDVTNNAPSCVLHNQMNLLGTHDTERILTVLGGVNQEGRSNHELARLRMTKECRDLAIKRLIRAYTILATLPGITTIFYGDEAGLEGYRDPFNRMPYPWGKEEGVLVDHYRNLGKIRNSNSVYCSGDFRLDYLDADLLIFTRIDDDSSFVTVVNNSDYKRSISFEFETLDLLDGVCGNKFILEAGKSFIYKTKKDSTLTVDQR